MTKKDFVALADALRIHNRTADGRTEFTPDHLMVLADFLASQDPNLSQKRWIDYIAGECGQGEESPAPSLRTKLVPRLKRDEDISKRGRRSRYNRISEAPTEET